MAKVAVFDSGLGSLSIIKAVQRTVRSEIIYFADQKNFPYGTKTKQQLGRIIQNTIRGLRDKFAPEVIVMASNTPSLTLRYDPRVIGVYPPIKAAAQTSTTKNIAVLGTKSVVSGKELDRYIARQRLPAGITVHKINASQLVDLVESGKFVADKSGSKKKISELLADRFARHRIDTATLSSTHLPVLAPQLRSELPGVRFLDPAGEVAAKVAKKISGGKRNRLHIYTSGDTNKFEKNLIKLGVRSKAKYLSI